MQVLATRGLSPDDLGAAITRFAPEVVHAHHASHAGIPLLAPAVAEAWAGRPLVVSLAGTDLYVDSAHTGSRPLLEAVLRRAEAVVLQSREAEEWVRRLFPGLGTPLVHVPKAVAWLGAESFGLRRLAGAGPGDVVFFHPAGVRPVKRNLECLLALGAAHRLCRRLRCVFAGPVLDEEYWGCFLAQLERERGFAAWAGAVPLSRMAAAYAGADVVVNASESEGLSNALLEAMVAGKPVLASDVPGNRWVVTGGASPFGVLFDPKLPEALSHRAVQLAEDDGLRARLAAGASERARHLPTPEEEAEALARVYRLSLRTTHLSPAG